MPEQEVATSDRFAVVLTDLTRIKDEVVTTQEWYRKHARRPMVLFRTFGVLVIILSVSVPFLTTLEGVWRTLVLPGVAVGIAALTGLNSFFQWQTQWQGFRQTQYTLEYLLSKWEIDIIKARHHSDMEQAITLALAATETLVDRAREATASETGKFFEGIQVPVTR